MKTSYKIATSTIVRNKAEEKSGGGLIVTAKPCIIETKDSVAAPTAPLTAAIPTKLAKEAPIKSSTVPYIQEEKEILKNINLVSKIKLTKFSSK